MPSKNNSIEIKRVLVGLEIKENKITKEVIGQTNQR